MVGVRAESNSFWARKIWLAWTAFQQLLSSEELDDGGNQSPTATGLGASCWRGPPALGLQRPSWGLALPEELEDGRNQARVHKLLSQKDLVGSDRLA